VRDSARFLGIELHVIVARGGSLASIWIGLHWLENAEVERRVKRRPQLLQRNSWPPSWVVPSLVTVTDLQRGHDINAFSRSQPTWPTLLQENRCDSWANSATGRVSAGR
jgi:hypothetical protein